MAAALALATLAITAAAARAAGSVRIVPVGGTGGVPVNLAQLTPDVPYLSYPAVATPGGEAKTVTVHSGYSLPQLFAALHIPPRSFGSVEIAAPAGPPVVLNRAQATNPFAYHRGPPVVWKDGAGVHFLVPSAPPGNANAGETFTGLGGTITIALHRSQPLYLGISGSPLDAIVGRPVGFSSRVYGTASATLHYQWTLGDGSGASQAAPTHAYTATGTYNVSLQVTGNQDSVGASSVIQIVVGKVPRRTAPHGGGSGRTGTGTTGGAGTRGSGAGKTAGNAKTRAPKRSAPIPRRPVGPLVSGIAISSVQPAAPARRAGAGATRAPRDGQLTPPAAGVGEGLWIALAALVMLLGGALLEWNGAPRARLATSRSR